MHSPALAAPAVATDLEILPPEVGGRESGVGNTLSVLPSPQDAVPLLCADRVHMVNGLLDASRISVAQGAALFLLAGLELLEVKREAGHGNFEQLFRTSSGAAAGKNDNLSFLNIPLRTAQRAMKLAKEGRKRLQPLAVLKDTPLHSLAPEIREKIIDEVSRAMEGSTYAQLAQEWNLAKANRGSTARGGNLLADSPVSGLRSPLSQDTAEQEAIDIYQPWLETGIREVLKERSWANAPEVGPTSKAALKGFFLDALELLRAGERGGPAGGPTSNAQRSTLNAQR